MIDIKTTKDKLTITIDVSAATIAGASVSKTGKSKIVATTGGFTSVQTDAGMLGLSLNLITKG